MCDRMRDNWVFWIVVLVVSTLIVSGIIWWKWEHVKSAHEDGILRWFYSFGLSNALATIFTYILIRRILWNYVRKYAEGIESVPSKGSLSPLIGIVERWSYTAALVLGIPQWIPIWLAMKVVENVTREKKRPAYNVFLIGNVVSIAFGLLGAWVFLGCFPEFPQGK